MLRTEPRFEEQIAASRSDTTVYGHVSSSGCGSSHDTRLKFTEAAATVGKMKLDE